MQRRWLLALVGSAFLSAAVESRAQVDEDLFRQGYLFGGAGSFLEEGAGTIELGGGMQWLVWKGLALGFDASAMGFAECFSCDGMVLGSVDLAYHFVRPSRRLVPFVLTGFGGVATGEGGVGLGNVGGGINYWFKNGMALRVEVRDRFDAEGIHNLGLRLGVTF